MLCVEYRIAEDVAAGGLCSEWPIARRRGEGGRYRQCGINNRRLAMDDGAIIHCRSEWKALSADMHSPDLLQHDLTPCGGRLVAGVQDRGAAQAALGARHGRRAVEHRGD